MQQDIQTMTRASHLGAVVPVEYRIRNWECAGSTLTRFDYKQPWASC